jgi:hypothetical protein
VESARDGHASRGGAGHANETWLLWGPGGEADHCGCESSGDTGEGKKSARESEDVRVAVKEAQERKSGLSVRVFTVS